MAVFDTRGDACESAEMTTARKTALIAVLAAAAGCGGAKQDSTEPFEAARGGQSHDMAHRATSHDGAGHMGSGEADEVANEMGDDVAGMPPSLHRFHDALAPHWHAAHGPERMAGTCAAIGELRAGADAIVAAPAPERHDAAAWSAGGKQLAEAVTALDATCKAHDAAGFETAFGHVHEQFHGLLEAGGEPKHGDGDHDGSDHDHH
jgi:hypothetical protein